MSKKFFILRNTDEAKLFCFSLSIICVLFISFSTKGDSWTQKANFPGVGVSYPFSFTIGNKGYVGTGSGSGGYVNDFWEYDPSTDVWTQKADFGGGVRWVACGFSIGNKGYAGTGYPAFNDFWEYDAVANTWTQKANFGGTGRYGAVGFAIDSFGYIATGGGSGYYNDLWQYNPIADTWVQKANLPGAIKVEANCFVIGTNAYIVAGWNGNFLSDLWEYNSITDSWIQKADFPGSARADAASFSICNKGYFGTGDPCFCTDFWQYDPVTDIWTQKADFGGAGRDETAFFSIGNKGYIGTGAVNSYYLNDFWEYTPDSACDANNNISNLNFAATDTTLCEKFCISFFDSSQNNPTAWLWNFPGGVPSSSTAQNPTNICYNTPGTFDVTLITTSASGNDTLTFPNYITVYPTPPFPTITQVGYTLTSSAATTYQWQLNSANISGATNQSYTVLQTGLYTVIVGDANGCVNSSDKYVLITGLDEVSDGNIFVYPNPASEVLIVEGLNYSDDDEIKISIVNVIGQEVFSSLEKISSSRWKKEIDLHEISSGAYFIEIKSQYTFVKKKIIIVK